MDEAAALEVLQDVGMFRTGHFVLTSGRHSDAYMNKDALYPFTAETSLLCRGIADRFKDAGIEAVIGPAIGAAILSQWVAHHLSDMTGRQVSAVYADKDGEGGFVIKRGYDKVINGRKTLIVEDLTTTGGSVKKVVEAARAVGADIVGAMTLCNRGGVTAADVGNPPVFEALVNVYLDSTEASDCELCASGIPVNTDVGHGREFLAHKGV